MNETASVVGIFSEHCCPVSFLYAHIQIHMAYIFSIFYIISGSHYLENILQPELFSLRVSVFKQLNLILYKDLRTTKSYFGINYVWKAFIR